MLNLKKRFHLNNPIGQRGEDIATKFLKRSGFRILERNYKNATGRSLGEIDIVTQEGSEIVFVEVKARTIQENDDVLPESAITPEKLRRLSRIAEAYMKERGKIDAPYRFDALAISMFDDRRPPSIRHLRNIYI
jgi:putative endonuclease